MIRFMFKNQNLSFRATTSLALLFIALSVGGCSGDSSSGPTIDYSGNYDMRIEQQGRTARLTGIMGITPDKTVLVTLEHTDPQGPAGVGTGVVRDDGSVLINFNFELPGGASQPWLIEGKIILEGVKTVRGGTVAINGQVDPEYSWSAACSSAC